MAASDRWRKIIEQHRRSGLAVTVFCRRTGVPQSSFFAWRRKLLAEVTFAEVRLPRERIVDADGIELRLPGCRCVVIRPGFDRQTLLELLAALEADSSDPATLEAIR